MKVRAPNPYNDNVLYIFIILDRRNYVGLLPAHLPSITSNRDKIKLRMCACIWSSGRG